MTREHGCHFFRHQDFRRLHDSRSVSRRTVGVHGCLYVVIVLFLVLHSDGTHGSRSDDFRCCLANEETRSVLICVKSVQQTGKRDCHSSRSRVISWTKSGKLLMRVVASDIRLENLLAFRTHERQQPNWPDRRVESYSLDSVFRSSLLSRAGSALRLPLR
jgi:hypothetical protein